jgi:hypothetical protein
MDRIQNTISNSSSIVACVSVTQEMRLLSHCLANSHLFWLHYSTKCHVTLFPPWDCSAIWDAVMLVLLMVGIYEDCHWDGPRCHDIHTKFNKTGSDIQKLLWEDTEIHTARWSHTPTSTFFKLGKQVNITRFRFGILYFHNHINDKVNVKL